MKPFTDADIMAIWEKGRALGPIAKPLTILQHAFPNLSYEDLGKLSIGQRDAGLLQIRKNLFGNNIFAVAQCESCKTNVEIPLDVDVLLVSAFDIEKDHSAKVEFADYFIHFQFPNSNHLALIAKCSSIEEARLVLLDHSIEKIEYQDRVISLDELPNSIVEKFIKHLSEEDPQAEIKLNYQCANCNVKAQSTFDISNFLWEEIESKAKDIFWEVHTLARAYGWTEKDVLDLSSIRRQHYVEMVI